MIKFCFFLPRDVLTIETIFFSLSAMAQKDRKTLNEFSCPRESYKEGWSSKAS